VNQNAGAGIGLGTTIKYLRRATSAAANNGLGTTIKYLSNQKRGRGRQLGQGPHTHKLGINSDEPPIVQRLL